METNGQADGRMDAADWFTFPVNAVGKHAIDYSLSLVLLALPLIGLLSMNP